MSSASQIEAAASAEWGILNAVAPGALRTAADLGSQHKTSAPKRATEYALCQRTTTDRRK